MPLGLGPGPRALGLGLRIQGQGFRVRVIHPCLQGWALGPGPRALQGQAFRLRVLGLFTHTFRVLGLGLRFGSQEFRVRYLGLGLFTNAFRVGPRAQGPLGLGFQSQGFIAIHSYLQGFRVRVRVRDLWLGLQGLGLQGFELRAFGLYGVSVL